MEVVLVQDIPKLVIFTIRLVPTVIISIDSSLILLYLSCDLLYSFVKLFFPYEFI